MIFQCCSRFDGSHWSLWDHLRHGNQIIPYRKSNHCLILPPTHVIIFDKDNSNPCTVKDTRYEYQHLKDYNLIILQYFNVIKRETTIVQFILYKNLTGKQLLNFLDLFVITWIWWNSFSGQLPTDGKAIFKLLQKLKRFFSFQVKIAFFIKLTASTCFLPTSDDSFPHSQYGYGLSSVFAIPSDIISFLFHEHIMSIVSSLNMNYSTCFLIR